MSIYRLFIVFLGIGFISISFANMNDDITRMNQESIEQKKLVSHNKINELSDAVMAEKQKNIDFLKGVLSSAKKDLSQKEGGKAMDGAVLFVSFSMSDDLILSLAQQARTYNIPVVIKGLVDSDFQKTLNKIQFLNLKAAKEHRTFSGISIDPVWFEQFGIDSVPALVVTKRPAGCEFQQACKNQPFDVVYGNSSIKDGLILIAEKGETMPLLARKILRGNDA